MSTAEIVLSVLSEVAETQAVREDPDLPLFERHVLTSLQTVELLIALSDKLGIELSPAEFERDLWATPRKIVAYVEGRLQQ